MRIPFTKMHGLGNDFVIVDCRTQTYALTSTLIQAMADRHRGIGFDQLLVLRASDQALCDAAYDIFNADGSMAQQCGNGARCLVAWLADDLKKTKIHLQSPLDYVTGLVQAGGQVKVNMGMPIFLPESIPFIADTEQLIYPLVIDDHHYMIHVVSMGNPHAVLEVSDIQLAPVATLGRQIATHGRFPEQANVEFVCVRDDHDIDVRVYERGVGETQACGSGACAVVAALIRNKRLQSPVQVCLPGGALTIEWPDQQAGIWMTGPTQRVFEGVWINEY